MLKIILTEVGSRFRSKKKIKNQKQTVGRHRHRTQDSIACNINCTSWAWHACAETIIRPRRRRRRLRTSLCRTVRGNEDGQTVLGFLCFFFQIFFFLPVGSHASGRRPPRPVLRERRECWWRRRRDSSRCGSCATTCAYRGRERGRDGVTTTGMTAAAATAVTGRTRSRDSAATAAYRWVCRLHAHRSGGTRDSHMTPAAGTSDCDVHAGDSATAAALGVTAHDPQRPRWAPRRAPSSFCCDIIIIIIRTTDLRARYVSRAAWQTRRGRI